MSSLFLADGFMLGGPELIIIALVLGMIAFWIWMIIDCAGKEDPDSKVVWILVITLAGIIGAAIYFFVRKLPRR